jgi:hypothetical protein
VLADFANSTGDPVFDGTLKTALGVSLRQSPFLNVLADSDVAKALKLMTRPVDTKLTSDVSRELCQREGSKAYIAGLIASLGSEYVLGLKAVNCQSGDTLAQEQATAAAKEKVLNALGEITSKLATFAIAYGAVGRDYYGLGELGRASEYIAKAFQLRNHASERESLIIAANYHENVTEELAKATQAQQERVKDHPHDYRGYLE